MRVAVLGLGEAGSLYSAAYVQAGCEVVGFDPRPIDPPIGVSMAGSIAEAVTDADLVLGLTTAKPSVAVAEEASGALPEGALFLDLNAASPKRKQEVAEAIGPGRKVVDGAVIGSVPRYGAEVHVLLSGPHSEEAAELLRIVGADAEPIQGRIGDASQRKLLRSVFMKGLGALITESMQAGEESGEVDWMRAQIAGELVHGEATLDRLLTGTRTHAFRRAAELGDSIDLLADHGRPWPMSEAARSVHLEVAREQASDVAAELAAIPTSALGDGGDRLGFLDADIKPMWDSAPIAGRAFTVHTRPGDNQAIHRALPHTRPGDILVVAGGGETNRALIGELIAERAQLRGIAGMVIDGAIRDAAEIEQLGFPVWAKAVSPAGPYKSGPGRLRETVSIAGAVCHHGDYIVADADGVLVVPATSVEQVVAAGRAVVADEQRRQKEIRATAVSSTQA